MIVNNSMLWVRISTRPRCTTLCDKVCKWLATSQCFSPGPPNSSTNKTDRHDITEILLKVALNTINKQTSSLTEQNKRPWRDVGNPVSGLGQAQKCGGVKSVNGIKCINGLKKEYYKKSETYGWNLDWIFFFFRLFQKCWHDLNIHSFLDIEIHLTFAFKSIFAFMTSSI